MVISPLVFKYFGHLNNDTEIILYDILVNLCISEKVIKRFFSVYKTFNSLFIFNATPAVQHPFNQCSAVLNAFANYSLPHLIPQTWPFNLGAIKFFKINLLERSFHLFMGFLYFFFGKINVCPIYYESTCSSFFVN